MQTEKLDASYSRDGVTMNGESTVLAGMVIGLSVAAPIGPMGVLCIQRTLTGGMAMGLSTGLGATAMQVFYGTLFLLGLREIGPNLADFMRAFNIGGGLLLLWLGLRLLRRRLQVQASRSARPRSLLLACGSAMALNACNPMLLLLIAGAITSVAGQSLVQEQSNGLLLFGLATGSAGWWIALSGAISVLRTPKKHECLMR